MIKPNVAIILVCWNNADLLTECLASISSQSYRHYRVVLVDNGSTDDSISVADALMPNITVIEAGHNTGFAEGNNIGIATALQDPAIKYIALLNTDARLDRNWLQAIIAFSHGSAKAASLQGVTLDYFDHEVIDSTHVYVDRSGYASQGHWKERFASNMTARRVFGVNAAACVITRDFIEAQPFKQLFDESMFMYLEDVDVAARAMIMGWNSYFVPDAIAYHIGSASSGGNAEVSGYALYMTFRNNLGLIIKNLPWSIVVRVLVRAPRADYRTVRRLLRSGERQAARQVVRGRLVSIVRLPAYLPKRAELRKVRRVEPQCLWSLMKRGYWVDQA